MKAVRCMSSVGCVVDVGVHEEIDGREIKFIASCTMCRPIFELCVNLFSVIFSTALHALFTIHNLP